MLKVVELFSGYGSQALALKRLGIDFTSTQCDIDKYAVQAYNQIHGETLNFGDITKVDESRLDKDIDLLTLSSPCQDFSSSGLQRGGEKGSGTRSSLLWECERIISATRPKYLLMENVKNLVGKKFMPCFQKWLQTLDDLGYTNHWKVLNAKNYGVPQNRERVFVVSIRKDINQGYTFPEPIKLEKRLKDILEENVDEKYYLSDKLIQDFFAKIEKGKDHPTGFNQAINICDKEGTATTLTSHYYKCEITDPYISEPIPCASRGRNPDNPSDRTAGAPTEQRLEINSQGICNTLTTVQKDNYVLEPAVFTPKRTEYGKQIRKAYENGDINESRHNMTIQEPRTDGIANTITTVQKDNYLYEPQVKQIGNILNTDSFGENPQTGRVYSITGLAPTITTSQGGNREPKIFNQYRIRKLTPRECFRLMGVADEDFNKLHNISKTQLYKLAGNSIVVDVLVAIFRNLLINKTPKDTTIFDLCN